jgi:hypothetical protein
MDRYADLLDSALPSPTVAAARGDRERVEALTRVCVVDLLSAFGLGETRDCALRRPLEVFARVPARRLARQAAVYDGIVGEGGLGAGGAWAMERMARRVEVEGVGNVPREGPLLLVANHPGLGDSLALFATAPRPDLRVIAAKRPFLDALPNTSRYLLTLDEASPGRLGIVRAAGRHLKRGGAVLMFPGGKIEPDPAVLPGAVEALGRWSGSVDLFARLVPGLRIVPAVVSGVISPAALRNPLTFLRRKREDREWLAATLQMLTPALRNVTTRVAFGEPVHAEGTSGEKVGRAVLQEARRLMGQCGPR